VPEGQLFCLLGPNGAGKTTTVSVLTTTLAPTSGRVRIAGLDLATEPGRVRRQLGVVFQQPSLDLNRGGPGSDAAAAFAAAGHQDQERILPQTERPPQDRALVAMQRASPELAGHRQAGRGPGAGARAARCDDHVAYGRT
jgi:ABC-type Mn2+/Zn2+ transport system ATPase subunit